MSAHDDLKEFKYVQCFRAPYPGRCMYCKTRSWKKGFKIYYVKTDKETIKCSDKKCYLEQGGKLDLFDGEILPDKLPTESTPKGTCLTYDGKDWQPPIGGNAEYDLLMTLMGRVSRLEYIVGRIQRND